MLRQSNLRLWENYHAFAPFRAELARQIIRQEIDPEHAQILDLGCGSSAMAAAFVRESASVFLADINLFRLSGLNANPQNGVQMAAENLGFRSAVFDAVILSDVLEHITDPAGALAEIRRVLKPGGVLYLTTPNRLSILNFFSDPHWNLPLVSVCSRKWVRFLVSKIFRREHLRRTDFAALLSWFRVRRLLDENRFQYQFVHRIILRALFESPRAVVCSAWHLRIMAGLNKIRCRKFFEKIIPNDPGWFNTWITPTWYLLGKKID